MFFLTFQAQIRAMEQVHEKTLASLNDQHRTLIETIEALLLEYRKGREEAAISAAAAAASAAVNSSSSRNEELLSYNKQLLECLNVLVAEVKRSREDSNRSGEETRSELRKFQDRMANQMSEGQLKIVGIRNEVESLRKEFIMAASSISSASRQPASSGIQMSDLHEALAQQAAYLQVSGLAAGLLAARPPPPPPPPPAVGLSLPQHPLSNHQLGPQASAMIMPPHIAATVSATMVPPPLPVHAFGMEQPSLGLPPLPQWPSQPLPPSLTQPFDLKQQSHALNAATVVQKPAVPANVTNVPEKPLAATADQVEVSSHLKRLQPKVLIFDWSAVLTKTIVFLCFHFRTTSPSWQLPCRSRSSPATPPSLRPMPP